MIYDDLSREQLIEELLRVSEESQRWHQAYESLRAFFSPVLSLVEEDTETYLRDECALTFDKEEY